MRELPRYTNPATTSSRIRKEKRVEIGFMGVGVVRDEVVRPDHSYPSGYEMKRIPFPGAPRPIEDIIYLREKVTNLNSIKDTQELIKEFNWCCKMCNMYYDEIETSFKKFALEEQRNSL